MAVDVVLGVEAYRRLIGQLQIVSPALADKVDHEDVGSTHVVTLEEHEIELLASAATTVRRSVAVDDSELDRLALL